MISSRRLSIMDRGTSVLKDISIRVAACECIGVGGASTSDKTTLLQAFAGVVRPSTGSIHLYDEERPADMSRLRRSVGYAAVDAIIGDGLRVDEYLRFVARMHSPRSTINTSTETSAARLVGLDPWAPIAQLAPRQRAALAMAAAFVRPLDVILIDGAVDVLPAPERTRVVSRLVEIRAGGAALLVVTDDADVQNALCRRVLTLVNGGVAEELNPPASPLAGLRGGADVRSL